LIPGTDYALRWCPFLRLAHGSLQTAAVPLPVATQEEAAGSSGQLAVAVGRERPHTQTPLPPIPVVMLVSGGEGDLYPYGGTGHPSSRDTGSDPECRIRIEVPPPESVSTIALCHRQVAKSMSVGEQP
jgi:hypothetical protein